MIPYLSARVTLVAIVFMTSAVALGQTLVLEVDLGDLQSSIVNNTASTISIDAYQIGSPAGFLDPGTWVSIQDSAAINPAAVTAALGSGAVFFMEASASNNVLVELNPLSFASWQSGTHWGIGQPFGTSLGQPFDALFDYVEAGSGAIVHGAINFVPEPMASWVLAIAVPLFMRRKTTTSMREPCHD